MKTKAFVRSRMQWILPLLAFLVAGCDDYRRESMTLDYAGSVPECVVADTFFRNHRVVDQFFRGNAETGFEIQGKGGTRIRFPNTAFVNAAGRIVTDTVTVRLRELLSRKDIIMSGYPSLSAEGPVITAGQLLINAEYEQLPLSLSTDRTVQPPQPVQVEVSMPGTSRIPSLDPVLFLRAAGSSGRDTVWQPVGEARVTDSSWEFLLPEFGAVSPGYQLPAGGNGMRINVQVDTAHCVDGISELRVFLCSREAHVVVPLIREEGGNFHNGTVMLPRNEKADIVVLGVDKAGFLLVDIREVTISGSEVYTVRPHKVTVSDLGLFINGLL